MTDGECKKATTEAGRKITIYSLLVYCSVNPIFIGYRILSGLLPIEPILPISALVTLSLSFYFYKKRHLIALYLLVLYYSFLAYKWIQIISISEVVPVNYTVLPSVSCQSNSP